MQTWSVVVTRDEAARRRLWKLHLKQDFILQAPVVLTFCSDWHRMTRWCNLRDADPGFDNLKSWITGQQDAVVAGRARRDSCSQSAPGAHAARQS